MSGWGGNYPVKSILAWRNITISPSQSGRYLLSNWSGSIIASATYTRDGWSIPAHTFPNGLESVRFWAEYNYPSKDERGSLGYVRPVIDFQIGDIITAVQAVSGIDRDVFHLYPFLTEAQRRNTDTRNWFQRITGFWPHPLENLNRKPPTELLKRQYINEGMSGTIVFVNNQYERPIMIVQFVIDGQTRDVVFTRNEGFPFELHNDVERLHYEMA